ncbi:MAG: Transcriptional regulator, IclR family, partial [uncultured Rubrobacteraceae bacterium]
MDSIGDTRVGGKSGVGVLDKAVGILSLLAEGGPATLAGVVRGTGLARPTAYRLLTALEAHGLVAREDGRYSLGSRLLGWGGGAVGSGLVEVARPVLAALRDRTEESTQLYVREGERRVCVASVERTGGGLRDAVPEGAVLPLEQGSGGRVLLAWSEGAEGGPNAEGLAEVRDWGWAESVAEREVGVAS